MGLRGFAPKPTAQRIAEGNRGRRPLPENEPQPRRLTTLPPPPDTLEGPGVDAWIKYGNLAIRDQTLADTDLMALEMLCHAWFDVQSLVDDIRENGRTEYVGEERGEDGEVLVDGKTRARPEWGMLKEAKAEFHRWCMQFGWSPSARARVQTLPEEVGKGKGAAQDPEARLMEEIEQCHPPRSQAGGVN